MAGEQVSRENQRLQNQTSAFRRTTPGLAERFMQGTLSPAVRGFLGAGGGAVPGMDMPEINTTLIQSTINRAVSGVFQTFVNAITQHSARATAAVNANLMGGTGGGAQMSPYQSQLASLAAGTGRGFVPLRPSVAAQMAASQANAPMMHQVPLGGGYGQQLPLFGPPPAGAYTNLIQPRFQGPMGAGAWYGATPAQQYAAQQAAGWRIGGGAMGAAPPPPPGGTGTPFSGNPFAYLPSGTGGAIAGAAMAGSSRFAGGLMAALPQARQNIIDASMLQTLIGNAQNAGTFRQNLQFGPNAPGVGTYGYTPQDMMAAANAYMPFARNATARDVNMFAGFGAGTGIGLGATANIYSQLARTGAIGGAQGGVGTTAMTGMMAAAMGGSAVARPQDWMQGFSDLMRQQQMMTITTPDVKTLTGYYGALNTNNVAGLAGTQGAQFLNTVSQGMAGVATGGSSAVRMAWTMALGRGRGASPALVTDILEHGLSTFTDPDTHKKYDPLRLGLDYINRTYRGRSLLDKSYVASQMFGVSMPVSDVLVDPKTNLLGGTGRAYSHFQRLVKETGLDLTSAQGASAARFYGDIANTTTQAQRDKVAARMRAAGVTGAHAGMGDVALARTALGGVVTPADTTRNYANALSTSMQNAAAAINDVVGKFETTGAGLINWASQHGLVTPVASVGLAQRAVDWAIGGGGGGGMGGGGGGIGGGPANTYFSYKMGQAGWNLARNKIPWSRVGAGARGVPWGAMGRGVLGVLGSDLALAGGTLLAGAAVGTAVGVAGSMVWNRHQEDINRSKVDEFLSNTKSHHMEGKWTRVSTGLFGLGHPGLQYSGPRGSYTVDIGNIKHDRSGWFVTDHGHRVDLSTIGATQDAPHGGASIVNAHTKAATDRTTNLVGRVLNTRQPLLTSTERQLDTDLRNFLKKYGDTLVSWQRSALSRVSGASGDVGDPSTGDTGGGDGGGGQGFSVPSGGAGFVNPFRNWSRGLGWRQDAHVRLAGGIEDFERGQIFSARAGTPIQLSQGAKYNAKLSDQYRSIFTLPNGQALSYMHGAMQTFKEGQFLPAGTQIGKSLAISGSYTGRTGVQYQSYPGASGTGIVEFGLYDTAQDAYTRNVPFGTGSLDPNAYLSHGGVGAGGMTGGVAGLSPALKKMYMAAGRRYGVPWQFLARQGFKESSWRSSVVSRDGGYGIAQFTGATGAAYLGGAGWQQRALNPQVAIMAQGHYMSDLLKREHGDLWAAARDYNGSGPAAVAYANSLMATPRGGASVAGGGAAVNHTGPVNFTGPIIIEVTLPDGTVEKLQGKARFEGVKGMTVHSTFPHHGGSTHPVYKKQPRR